MSYTALYRKFRPTSFEDVQHCRIRSKRTVSGMHIYSAELAEQERQR